VTEVEAQKQALRRSMSARRAMLSARDVAERSAVICARLGSWTASLPAPTGAVALYAAIRNEVDLSGLSSTLRDRGTVVAYPRVCPPARLTFHRVTDASELVPTGRYQIPEPPPAAPEVSADALQIIVVPGLAFDTRGARLGWGAGYYDQLLARAPSARRVGVCFDFQLVERCPRGAVDQPVHLVATEDRMVVTQPTEEVCP
jgi:5-formyltetrahydrofolate cyclo-ligase